MQGQDLRFKMRTFPETGFSGEWSKQTILVGVGGGRFETTLFFSTLFAYMYDVCIFLVVLRTWLYCIYIYYIYNISDP